MNKLILAASVVITTALPVQALDYSSFMWGQMYGEQAAGCGAAGATGMSKRQQRKFEKELQAQCAALREADTPEGWEYRRILEPHHQIDPDTDPECIAARNILTANSENGLLGGYTPTPEQKAVAQEYLGRVQEQLQREAAMPLNVKDDEVRKESNQSLQVVYDMLLSPTTSLDEKVAASAMIDTLKQEQVEEQAQQEAWKIQLVHNEAWRIKLLHDSANGSQ